MAEIMIDLGTTEELQREIEQIINDEFVYSDIFYVDDAAREIVKLFLSKLGIEPAQ